VSSEKEHVKLEYSVPCANRYTRLDEREVEDRGQRETEVCFAAEVIKNISADTEHWALDRDQNVCVLRRSTKPVVILRHNTDILKALVDTGAERCVLNYSRFRCLKNEPTRKSKVRIKGINGTTNQVCGEVELELQLSPGCKIKVDALIIKDTDIGYDLILGRDLLKEAELNMKTGTLKLRGNEIKFLDRVDKVERKTTQKEMLAQTECLVAELIMQRHKKKKRKWIAKINEATTGVTQTCSDRKNGRARTECSRTKTRPRESTSNVHVSAQVIEANSIKIVNAFARTHQGEYIMPKAVLKTGLMTAEGLLRIKDTDGECPVMVINPTDTDIIMRENELIGRLIPHMSEDTTSEVYVTTVAESLEGATAWPRVSGDGKKCHQELTWAMLSWCLTINLN